MPRGKDRLRLDRCPVRNLLHRPDAALRRPVCDASVLAAPPRCHPDRGARRDTVRLLSRSVGRPGACRRFERSFCRSSLPFLILSVALVPLGLLAFWLMVRLLGAYRREKKRAGSIRPCPMSKRFNPVSLLPSMERNDDDLPPNYRQMTPAQPAVRALFWLALVIILFGLLLQSALSDISESHRRQRPDLLRRAARMRRESRRLLSASCLSTLLPSALHGHFCPRGPFTQNSQPPSTLCANTYRRPILAGTPYIMMIPSGTIWKIWRSMRPSAGWPSGSSLCCSNANVRLSWPV